MSLVITYPVVYACSQNKEYRESSFSNALNCWRFLVFVFFLPGINRRDIKQAFLLP